MTTAKKLMVGALVSVLLLPGAPVFAQAEAPPQADNLQQLLDIVRRGGRAENSANKRREAAFRADKANQKKLLVAAIVDKENEELRSEELEEVFEVNELEIPRLQEQLRNRLGTLGELFGVVRQVAGDTFAFVETSLVSAELPGRAEFLSEFAQSKDLPEVAELEKLWFALQQEIIEGGKISRFTAIVQTPDGEEIETEVVRVGPFTAIADGKFLRYVPETGKLAVLPRQPGSSHPGNAADLSAATSGIVQFSIDPTRGSLLASLVQTPDLTERIGQGGIVGYVIIVLGILGVSMALWRFIYLMSVGSKMRAQEGSETPDESNPLGRVLKVYADHKEADVETLELKLDEAILREVPGLERGNTLIKVLGAVSPLLGLLGTVTGMINTFQAITLFGTGDPKLMAGGISQALVTTVLGLVAAIPLLLLHSVVAGRSKAMVQVLEEQSAGLIARQAEREGKKG
ncbi:MAG: MotA/TolQ/ExbB proton channel family protein [Deltaproteobacteria bacterium]